MLHAREVGKSKSSRIDAGRLPYDAECDAQDELIIELGIVR